MKILRIGVIGLGFVGDAILKSFNEKTKELGLTNIVSVVGYDKYKNGGIGCIDDCLKCNIIFLALPTNFNDKLASYEYDPIYETCDLLQNNKFDGLIVIKSTIEPTVTDLLGEKYNNLHFVHNPEFLTARTAFEDFHNQKHIVLGKGSSCPENKILQLINIYKQLYPEAKLSVCSSSESESMKIFCNTFYAVKIQMFNELYVLCQKTDINYNNVVDLMLKNNWINPMHTQVPGTDGKLSYGGMCFPKDTKALLEFMKKNNSPHAVLEATIKERNIFRNESN